MVRWAALTVALVSTSAFAPARPRAARAAVVVRAVDYDATLYESGDLKTDDEQLAAWCRVWARRAVLGKGGGAVIKLTTPVECESRPDGVALLFAARASGYADKDRAREKGKGGDDDAAPPPPRSKEGGVALVAAKGRISAVRIAYDGGVVKGMSEGKLVDRLKEDIRAAGFG